MDLGGWNNLNYPAVAVAAAAAFALGAVWFSPAVLGKPWLDGLGKKKEELGSPMIPMTVTVFTALITSLVLSYVLMRAGIGSWKGGLLGGLGIGVGIVAATMLSDYLFIGHRMKLFLVEAGYRVTQLAIMGAILGAWR